MFRFHNSTNSSFPGEEQQIHTILFKVCLSPLSLSFSLSLSLSLSLSSLSLCPLSQINATCRPLSPVSKIHLFIHSACILSPAPSLSLFLSLTPLFLPLTTHSISTQFLPSISLSPPPFLLSVWRHSLLIEDVDCLFRWVQL